jgi:uncharacterized membrane protein
MLDVPTIAETIATARGMLSPRARAGLDAQPADEQARTASVTAPSDATRKAADERAAALVAEVAALA